MTNLIRFIDFFKSLLFIQCILYLPLLNAENISTDFRQDVPQWQRFTAPCGPSCTCGCVQGGPCTCSSPVGLEEKQTSYSYPTQQQLTSPCGPSCTCGCVQGGPCTCSSPVGLEANQTSYSYPAQQQQYSTCGPDCPCGCAQGGPCTCSLPEEISPSYNNPQLTYETTPFFEGNDGETICHQDDDDDCDDDDCDDDTPNNIDPDLSVYEPCCGIWLPEDPVLFRPFMADPREIAYSAGWRFNDNALTKNVIDVSFGDALAIYRWCNAWPWGGELQIEIEGAVWAVFDPITKSAPLINADYYGGLPITYAIDRWQFRLRVFHISSHIGDEYLLNHPGFDRRNASSEYIDFFISHDLTEEIRVYAGLGYIARQDDEFKIKPFYSAFGAELRLLSAGFKDDCDRLYGCPIFGMHFRQNGEFKKHIDSTFILGYEFGKLCGLYRKLRFFLEYHDGYSVEGQFCTTPTNYFSIRTSYGF